MNTNDFDFELPEELIAQTPLEQRDASKLLVIDPVTKEMTDTHFDHIIDQLNPGDTLVMNNTRVLPARLYGEKPDTHGHVEFLLLKNTQGDQWEVLAKPAKRLKVGAKVSFGDGRLTATVTEELDHGGRIVEFNYDGIFLEVLKAWVRCHCHLISMKNWKTATVTKQSMPRKMALPLLQQLASISLLNYFKRLKLKA